MAAADPDDPDGMHRLCWLSEQVRRGWRPPLAVLMLVAAVL